MLPRIRPAEPKSLAEIRREWDRLAEIRYAQISAGRDFSYSGILAPTILRVASETAFHNILDAGCGVGFLTRDFARICEDVVGIDVSESSTSIALRVSRAEGLRCKFFTESVERFAANSDLRFELIVANMMLMSSPNLEATLAAIATLLAPSGRLILTITHPWFWPRYWGYDTAPWFRYDREIVIEAPFTISFDSPSESLITHIHRPLQRYVASVIGAGLQLTALLEPSLPEQSPEEYRERWRFPRFLAMVCGRPDL